MNFKQVIVAAGVAFIALTASVQAKFSDSLYIPDIETFMQIGANSGPQASSDGAVTCFISNQSGASQVYRLTSTGWPSQLTFFPDGTNFYALSHDGRWLIAGAAKGGSEETNLHLVEVATGRTEALTDVPKVQIADPHWSKDGSKIYYRSNEANGKDFHIFELDLATRAKRAVFVKEGYNAPEIISDDGKWLVVGQFPSNVDADLYLVNLQSGTADKLTPHDGSALYSAYSFDKDNATVYITTNANKDGVTRRAILDVRTKIVSFLEEGTQWDVDGITFSDDMTRMAWLVNEDGYGRLHIWDMTNNIAMPSPMLDGVVDGGQFIGNDAVVISFNSATSAPDCWRWEIKTSKLTQLTYAASAGIDSKIFVHPELVKFASFDGLPISGFLFMPPGKKKGDRVPMIISAHGGRSQYRPTFVRSFQYYALNGFGVFALNPRGSSGYGRDFLDMDNYKDRWKSVKDYEAATRWLAKEGYADSARIAVTGGSYGGYMTLACITSAPTLYAAACDQVGIANFVTFLKNTAAYRRALRESEYGPLSDSTFLWQISPVSQVDKVKAPLLIIHGENDPRVPVGEARQMAKAISERGGIVDTLIFPDEGHGVAKRANQLVQYRRIVDFFKKYLLAPQPAN